MSQAILRPKLTTRKARVIIIQQPMKRVGPDRERPAFDFLPAQEFGQIEVLTTNAGSRAAILDPEAFKAELEEKLAGFDPQRDYIIAAGNYTLQFFVGMFVGQRWGACRVLHWDPAEKAYKAIVLTVS